MFIYNILLFIDMINKKYLSILAGFVLGIVIGVGSGFLIFENNTTFTNSGCLITSLEDNQEVHSIVVVDATTWGASRIEVLVNDIEMANYLPFYWNNMLEPVGEYSITVNIYGDNDTIISSDTKKVIIPETWTVPEDYEFTENFVVHKGQTVYINYATDIASDSYYNGKTDIDEKTYFYINNFGNLYINAKIKAQGIYCEENSNLYLNAVVETIDISEEMILVNGNKDYYIRLDDSSYIEIDLSVFDDYHIVEGGPTVMIELYPLFGEFVLVALYESATYAVV